MPLSLRLIGQQKTKEMSNFNMINIDKFDISSIPLLFVVLQNPTFYQFKFQEVQEVVGLNI